MEKGMATGIILFLLMCIIGIIDIRSKKIPLWCISLGAADAVVSIISAWRAGTGGIGSADIAVDMLPGLLFLLISWTTNEKVGYGDGLVILIMGIVMHYRQCVAAVAIGLLVSSVFSMIMIASKKMNLRSRIPFVPFLTIGVGILLWAK